MSIYCDNPLSFITNPFITCSLCMQSDGKQSEQGIYRFHLDTLLSLCLQSEQAKEILFRNPCLIYRFHLETLLM